MNNSKTKLFELLLAAVIATSIIAPSCGVNRKLKKIQKDNSIMAELSLGIDTSNIPLVANAAIAKDTLTLHDDEGKEILIMKAIKDEETGEMVATEVLEAAVVTARFRNIAERKGKVTLSFQVKVPKSLQDNNWQLRFFPDMFMMGDSIRLDPVVITGKSYKKAQLRGFQRYAKLMNSIVSDTTRFIDLRSLEIFMERYVPEVYALKTDTSYVSDEQMSYLYGITQQQAIEHYTDKIARAVNHRKIRRKNDMYERYIKGINPDGDVRLDTVMVSADGDFIYNYVQVIDSRPGLKKVDIKLSGDIFQEGKKIYTIPANQPLAFYISTLSIFTQDYTRYVTKVVERRAEANTSCFIEFASGKSNLDLSLADNAAEVDRIKSNLNALVNDTVFDLDSIIITASASPEGSLALNNTLSKDRSSAITNYFRSYIKSVQDSLDAERGFSVDEFGNITADNAVKINVPLISRSNGENWDMLDYYVENDTVLTAAQKKEYASFGKTRDLDQREAKFRNKPYYAHLRNDIYPKLRAVRFDFFLHRKGMVKDTVHTTEVDTMYARGLYLLKEMEYKEAIEILAPYHDFNTAVAYMAEDMNYNALTILEKLEKTAEVNYLLAILYSRTGNPEKAVDSYMKACKQSSAYIYRGNLDPEISELIRIYGLNKDDEDDLDLLY